MDAPDSPIPTDDLFALIADLQQPAQTSMRRWIAYWRARYLLRDLALRSYDSVTAAYVSEGKDQGFPSEGFKEIAADITEAMQTVSGRTGMDAE